MSSIESHLSNTAQIKFFFFNPINIYLITFTHTLFTLLYIFKIFFFSFNVNFFNFTGNSFNHGLYHGLIPVFDIPFLNTNPPPEARLATAQDVMATGVIVVPKLCHISHLEELLEKCIISDNNRTHKGKVNTKSEGERAIAYMENTVVSIFNFLLLFLSFKPVALSLSRISSL